MKLEIMCLAKGMAKAPDGNGFSGKGDWDLYKCFYQHGKDNYAEFYLNINLTTMVAELKSKEGAYVDILTEAFGRAMRGA